jgi:hypothetical protein
MPLLVMLNDGDKYLLAKYLNKFKHSILAKKLVLCSYWATTYRPGLFISFKSFLIYSLKEDKEPTDAGLMKAWGITNIRYKNVFFGFNLDTIINGNLNDVEAMITEWIDQEEKAMEYLDEIQGG